MNVARPLEPAGWGDVLDRLAKAEARLQGIERRLPSDRVTIVAFSRDFDKMLTTLLIATGAAAMGSEVSIFFAFWGLTMLKKAGVKKRRRLTSKLLATMLPSGVGGTSQMNMFGIGPAFFQYLMKEKNIRTVDDLMALARESGVKLIACGMSMDVMGVEQDELIDGVVVSGVAGMLGDACDSRATFFVG